MAQVSLFTEQRDSLGSLITETAASFWRLESHYQGLKGVYSLSGPRNKDVIQIGFGGCW